MVSLVEGAGVEWIGGCAEGSEGVGEEYRQRDAGRHCVGAGVCRLLANIGSGTSLSSLLDGLAELAQSQLWVSPGGKFACFLA